MNSTVNKLTMPAPGERIVLAIALSHSPGWRIAHAEPHGILRHAVRRESRGVNPSTPVRDMDKRQMEKGLGDLLKKLK